MRRRGKKCRKTVPKTMGETPIANMENSFSNIFCCKGEIHNFRKKASKPATRSCTLSKNSKKKKREDEQNQKKQLASSEDNNFPLSWLEDNGFFRFPAGGKISSVAFFIPLNGLSYSSSNKDGSRQKIIDWNNLLFYECSNAAIWSHYENENINKMFFIKPTVLPELRLKCRTISESSTNSEDSFICFEGKDDVMYDNDYVIPCSKFDSSRNASSSRGLSKETELSQKTSRKKVCFEDMPDLVTVHLIVAWDYAYRAARISPWETIARDANRFKLKIQSLEPILSPVLSLEHRTKVYQRMQNSVAQLKLLDR